MVIATGETCRCGNPIGCVRYPGDLCEVCYNGQVDADKKAAAEGFRPTHQHYKGGLYQVLLEAIEEVTLEPCIVYRSENGHNWVRYKSVFEQIMPDGRPRFAPLDRS